MHVTDSVDPSRSAAEQGAYERLRMDRALRSERAAEQNANRSMRVDLPCYRHGVLLQGKKGNTRPLAGEQKFPAREPSRLTARRGLVIARRRA